MPYNYSFLNCIFPLYLPPTHYLPDQSKHLQSLRKGRGKLTVLKVRRNLVRSLEFIINTLLFWLFLYWPGRHSETSLNPWVLSKVLFQFYMLHFSVKYNNGTGACFNFGLFSLVSLWLGKKMQSLPALLEFLEHERPFLCWTSSFLSSQAWPLWTQRVMWYIPWQACSVAWCGNNGLGTGFGLSPTSKVWCTRPSVIWPLLTFLVFPSNALT